MKKLNAKLHSNQSGFIVADFLFSLVLVISCSVIIFVFTLSLATIEISQYIVWSTARNYSAANETKKIAQTQAQLKFKNLADQFPKLTGNNNSSPWITLTGPPLVGNLIELDPTFKSRLGGQKEENNQDQSLQKRQPWIGASAIVKLNLLQNLKVPFIGPVGDPSADTFSFPVRAFILRHPSQEECKNFYFDSNSSIPTRFTEGIQKITGEDFDKIKAVHNIDGTQKYVPMEDNGC